MNLGTTAPIRSAEDIAAEARFNNLLKEVEAEKIRNNTTGLRYFAPDYNIKK